MRIGAKLVAACAVVAVLLACVTVDSPFSGDDGDDDVATTVAGSLSAVLPAARTEPELVMPACSDAAFVDDDQAPKSRASELEIFRPPRARA